MPKNYYIKLGIPADSSQADLKSAYRRLAKEFHPDRLGKSFPFLKIHEALSMEDSDEVPQNHVLQEFQKGYLLKDRLIRPAKVIVSTGRG